MGTGQAVLERKLRTADLGGLVEEVDGQLRGERPMKHRARLDPSTSGSLTYFVAADLFTELLISSTRFTLVILGQRLESGLLACHVGQPLLRKLKSVLSKNEAIAN